MHLFDELPDVDIPPRFYCPDCRRRTLFNRDSDGMPVCRECTQDEEVCCE